MKKTILAILAMLFVSLTITACGADAAAGTYNNSGVVDMDLVNGSATSSSSAEE